MCLLHWSLRPVLHTSSPLTILSTLRGRCAQLHFLRGRLRPEGQGGKPLPQGDASKMCPAGILASEMLSLPFSSRFLCSLMTCLGFFSPGTIKLLLTLLHGITVSDLLIFFYKLCIVEMSKNIQNSALSSFSPCQSLFFYPSI